MNKVATAKKVSISSNVNGLIIKLFNAAIPTKGKTDFTGVNEYAVKIGYLIHPDISNQEVLDYLKTQTIDYNSTFYKKWSSVINKSRFELFIDQLLHYASTYGTGFTGEPYIPEINPEVPAYNTLKVIVPITKAELIDRIEKMMFSGIAMSQTTIQDLLTILNAFKHKLNIGQVKNKEAKMFLYKETDTTPTDTIEMVRFLVYLATEKTLLIKDRKTIAEIKKASSRINLSKYADEFGMERLASVFHRFKPIFLALKNISSDNSTCVNKLRKLANKYHNPMQIGFFESILAERKSLNEIVKKLSDITNFKKILLLQTISVRLKELNTQVYLVRNQKIYIKQESNSIDKKYLASVYTIIYQDLVKSMKKKACSISLPKGINLTLPTSEKSFIGNYPIGTSFDLGTEDVIVGINWRGEDGACDLDLRMHDIDGKVYGWNSSYKNASNTVVFSGDMTFANPEATELFYAANGFKSSIIKVNLFSGADNSKFRFFIAKEKVNGMKQNYMVDPNNILFTIESEMDSKEKTLGVLADNKFILAQFRSGKGRVSYVSVTDLYTEYALKTLDCYVSLNDLLVDAGFTITDKKPKIDLTTISKDSLINLLS